MFYVFFFFSSQEVLVSVSGAEKLIPSEERILRTRQGFRSRELRIIRSRSLGVGGSKSGHVGLVNDDQVYGYYWKGDSSPWKV